MSEVPRPFHLAIPVTDLEIAREWYCRVFGCSLGRQSAKWVDFNFFGHQLVAPLVEELEAAHGDNLVDGKQVPPRHFGIILTPEDWKHLAETCTTLNLNFRIEPHTRLRKRVGEQSTFFLDDPFGNTLEFKAYEDDGQIFAKY